MTKRTDRQKKSAKRWWAGLSFLFALALFFFWLIAVSWASLDPSPPGLRYLTAFAQRFPEPELATRILQGILHLALYAAGALVVVAAVRLVLPRLPMPGVFLIALAVVMAVGFVLEVLQTKVPNRAFDLIDLTGDLVGALLALALVWLFRFRFAR